MHTLSKKRHESIQLTVVTLAPHYHIKYKSNELVNLHTNGGTRYSTYKQKTNGINWPEHGKNSTKPLVHKSLLFPKLLNHVLSQLIHCFNNGFIYNALLATLIVHYVTRIHWKLCIILYIIAYYSLNTVCTMKADTLSAQYCNIMFIDLRQFTCKFKMPVKFHVRIMMNFSSTVLQYLNILLSTSNACSFTN